MHFCQECDNMYYIKIHGDDCNQLTYYCRNCGFEDNTITKDNICVSNTQLNKERQQFNHIINDYTKYDPTLPHISNIDCPNSDCICNKPTNDDMDDNTVKNDIIFIRYDDSNLNYIYVCTYCNTSWTNNN
jgi:DNA-directed RNA polymerase subunit M/transcription elongation factor TFIIS